MRRAILFPALAIIIAGLIYLFYPQNAMTGNHAMAQATPGNTSEPVMVGDVTVSGAWANAMLPGQPAGSGYMVIENKGVAADRLLFVTSPMSTNIQIHEMSMEGDVMKMRALPDGLSVPAGGTVVLKPGGLHLMFMDMQNGFKAGDNVPLKLKFKKAGDVELNMLVGPAG